MALIPFWCVNICIPFVLSHVTIALRGQSKVAERISAAVSIEYASTLNVVYFPQLGLMRPTKFSSLVLIMLLGFLICVPMRDDWRENGVDVMDGWIFQVPSICPVSGVPY